MRTNLCAIAALIVVACSTPARPVAVPAAPADPALAARLDAVIDKAIANQIVGVVVVVAKDGKIVYERGAGYSDREAKRPVRIGTMFRLASMSKPFVTMTALALVDAGKLALEDPVTKYLPAFRPKLADGREPIITVRHLLTHTSGIGYRFINGGAYTTANVSDGIAEPGMLADENLRRIASVPLLYEPGTSWSYGLSIDVLGEVIAKAAGRPLPDVVASYVTGKLGITQTGFRLPDPDTAPTIDMSNPLDHRYVDPTLATPYVAGSPPVRMTEPHDVSLGEGIVLTMSPQRAFDTRSFPSGGAGMVGTARNYLVFLEALRMGGAPILKPETARAAMSNQIGSIESPFLGKGRFGFGFGIDAGEGKRSAGTVGWGGVYGTGFWIDPAAKLSVVIMTNVAGETPLEGEIQNAIYSSK